MAAPRSAEQQGRDYLERHRLPALLEHLSALLLYHRPERPREFLMAALEQVAAGRHGEGRYPGLMDDANLAAMFELLDPAGQGHISVVQYREALKTLGLSTEGLPPEDVTITLDTFAVGVAVT
uniref:EF-hand calcium binding domain 10 n=1 Tax=Nothoprocta perdicaria TaxID=30464 RepID=A0A8C7A0L1_NOTPE